MFYVSTCSFSSCIFHPCVIPEFSGPAFPPLSFGPAFSVLHCPFIHYLWSSKFSRPVLPTLFLQTDFDKNCRSCSCRLVNNETCCQRHRHFIAVISLWTNPTRLCRRFFNVIVQEGTTWRRLGIARSCFVFNLSSDLLVARSKILDTRNFERLKFFFYYIYPLN